MLTSVIATILLIYTRRTAMEGPLSFTLPELMPVPGEEKENCF